MNGGKSRPDITLSVRASGAGFDPNGKLMAQAWLVVGDTIVVGAAGTASMSQLARIG